MIYKTKGIVLKVVKYGETSMIASVYTELFGMQSYIINGVRKQQKTNRIGLLQPGAILELEAYHQENKNLQRLKDFQWATIYKSLLSDVIKNSILTYLVELFYNALKQPEANPSLFYFFEDSLLFLDQADSTVSANFSLYFSIQLPQFFGFKIEPITHSFSEEKEMYIDLLEGCFVEEKPNHSHYLDNNLTSVINDLLKVMHPSELIELKINKATRKKLLVAFQQYYALHLPDFGWLKSFAILQEVLS